MSVPFPTHEEDAFDPASAMVRTWTEALEQANAIGRDSEAPYAESGYLVDEATFDLPVELQLFEHDNGQLALHASSPTQKTETTILPVWHRMRLTLALGEAPDGTDS